MSSSGNPVAVSCLFFEIPAEQCELLLGEVATHQHFARLLRIGPPLKIPTDVFARHANAGPLAIGPVQLAQMTPHDIEDFFRIRWRWRR